MVKESACQGQETWFGPLTNGKVERLSPCATTIEPFWWLGSNESACNADDVGSILGSGRSPGEGNGKPLSVFAWEIPWTEEPGGLQSVGSQELNTP